MNDRRRVVFCRPKGGEAAGTRAPEWGLQAHLAQWVEQSPRERSVAGSSPVIRIQKETQRRVPARTENGLRPKSQDNSAVLKPQADGPWQNVARLGSAHLEPARLTVSELPNRYAQRVNRHTPKKAVMVIYFRAGSRRADVDKRATVAPQGGRYTHERMAANDVVSVVASDFRIRWANG